MYLCTDHPYIFLSVDGSVCQGCGRVDFIQISTQGRDPPWFLLVIEWTQQGMRNSPVLVCENWMRVFSVAMTAFIAGNCLHTRRNLLRPPHPSTVCLLGKIVLSVIDHLHGVDSFCWVRPALVCARLCTRLSSPLVEQNLWNAKKCHFWTGARAYY